MTFCIKFLLVCFDLRPPKLSHNRLRCDFVPRLSLLSKVSYCLSKRRWSQLFLTSRQQSARTFWLPLKISLFQTANPKIQIHSKILKDEKRAMETRMDRQLNKSDKGISHTGFSSRYAGRLGTKSLLRMLPCSCIQNGGKKGERPVVTWWDRREGSSSLFGIAHTKHCFSKNSRKEERRHFL